MNKWIALIGTILICSCFLVTATFTIPAANDSVSNDMILADLNVTLEEEFDDTILEIQPGQNREKIVRLVNYSDQPALVRAMVHPRIVAGDGKTILPVDTTVSCDMNTVDGWENGQDGYYYYTKVLYPGQSTQLFSKVSLSASLDQAYMGARFFVTVKSEACIINNLDTHHSAWWSGSSPLAGTPLAAIEQAIQNAIAVGGAQP